MRIVAHNGSDVYGGGEIAVARLLHGLQARSHSVLMLCRDRVIAERIASVHNIPTGVQRIGGDALLSDALLFAARVRRERPDVVLLTTFKKVFLAGLGARLAKAPKVVQRIGLERDTPARGARYRYAFRHFVDVVALNSHSIRDDFLASDPRIDERRVYTLYNGVPARKPAAKVRSWREQLNIPADAFVVGAVGRLAYQKRFDRLLHAVAAMPLNAHCIIAGEGTDGEQLLRLARDLGIAERVHFLGFRDDVAAVLDALDMYVVSSEREGMSNAMLEAMALGVPVVSTPVSGAHESLEPLADGTPPGIIVEPDPQVISRNLADLLVNPERRKRMGEAARLRVQERFNEAVVIDRWEELLAAPAIR